MYASHLAGREYGQLGRVVGFPPSLWFQGWHVNKKGQTHGLERANQRGMSIDDINAVIQNAIVAFEQRNGTATAFLSQQGFVAMMNNGDVITVYSPDDFDDGIRAVLRDAGVE